MIEIKNVSFTYPDFKGEKTLQNVNLNFPKGEFISLIGKSGSGKSTLFKLLTTQFQPDAGQILFDGRPIQLGDVGYMPQKDLLLPWATILENVRLSGKLDKQHPVSKEKALEWLDKAGLKDYAYSLPKDLSGGMRQRAAFVRTILANKPVLLLDEPFGALDSFTQYEMQQWLLSLWQELNKTIVFITHNIDEAVLLSNRVFLLQNWHNGDDTQIKEWHIDLPRPRPKDIRYHAQFIEYKQALEVAIHE
ncbi:ABC transporter ATP-binding protein [Globicatella sp. PHS-GS-PNBC-21-1553]|uniref:ABC transporter ATP-binding protein n=1 Tax=Globicatella sp. PHS-GS-PNBC-21-1553 TaxID=2885764 RepID=UPI00298F16C7|nr:ABC transporter ATP-binding protein [Globicatella sp. PHS-GS-PNBC-21-1553]WPC08061.1 ABC transporter ATP-binding protein [Globicatella sp. PHS-GS-PNBC-21-1553]